MNGPHHRIRKQSLELETDSERLALSLQPRLEALNRRRLIPLIERLLDEVSRPDLRLRLDRLEIDLGTLSESDFEREAERRLERELRRALREEVQRAERDPGPDRRSLPERAYRRELLEHYLRRGTVPYWGPDPGDFSLEALVTEMLEATPEDLARTVRHLGHQTSILERIVLQLPEALLRRLIRLLEPEHAALILAYMVDLRKVHRTERLVPLSEPRFAQTLWLLTQIYLLQDPGSQFNRRSFLRSLLRGLATGQGLDYRRLLLTLEHALTLTRGRRSVQSSLPAVVAELVRELDHPGERPHEAAPEAETPAPEDLDALIAALAALPSGDTGAALDAGPDARSEAGEWIRRIAGRLEPGPAVVVRRLLEEQLPQRLLELLAPTHRDWISELIRTRTRGARLQRHGVSEGLQGFGLREAALWETVLQVLVRRGAAGWSPGELLRRILRQISERTGVAESRLIGGLAETLPSTGTAATPPVRKLARVLDEVGKRAESRPVRARETAIGESPLQTLGRYELVESLRHFLRHGMLPWTDLLRGPERTPDRILAGLARLPRSLLNEVLRAGSREEETRVRRRLAMTVEEETLVQVLLRLLPATAAPDHPFRSALAEHASRAANRRLFLVDVLLTLLQGQPLDLEALAKATSPKTSAKEVAQPEPDAPLDRWPAAALQAALLTRLRFGTLEGTAAEGPETGEAEDLSPRFLRDAPAAIREIPLARLLSTLVESHPEDAEELLHGLRERRHLWVALMRRLPVAVVDRLLGWLAPEESAPLAALQDALVAIPISHRPGSRERLAPVILGEVVRSGRGETLTQAFFAHVLRELFGQRLPEEAHLHLMEAARDWKTSSKLPAAQRKAWGAAFEAALSAAAARSEGRAKEAPPARPVDSARSEAAAWVARREAVFTFLLGKPAKEAAKGSVTEETVLGLGELSGSSLKNVLREVAERSPEDLRRFLHLHLGSHELRERWSRELSESTLARLAAVLEPRRSATLLDTAELLASATLESAFPGAAKIVDRTSLWSFTLGFLDRNAGADRLFERWVHAFFAHVADRLPTSDADAANAAGVALWQTAERLAQMAGHARLRALLHRDRARLMAGFRPGAPGGSEPTPGAEEPGPERAPERAPQSSRPREEPRRPRAPKDRRKTAFGLERDEARGGIKEDEPIYIDNAGLVLTGPFLPQLFGTLGFLKRDDEGKVRIADREHASRAVHLLQYLADGRTSAPEPLLVLNKLLAGVPLGAPVAREIEMTDEERESCDKVLRSMLAGWEILSGTSVAGLQETFLQREGRLHRSDDGWKLKVQRKTVDVLVDQVPWSVSVILQSWMPEPIYVEW